MKAMWDSTMHQYKISVHYGREYGEIYDLVDDPGELKNLWDSSAHKDLKMRLFEKFIHAEMAKAPQPMPGIAPA